MEEPHERLQRARRDAGFDDATAAARRFHWNKNTYRSHENGERGLRPKVAAKYAAAFKVSASWLLTGEGSRQPAGIPIRGHVGADGRPDVVVFNADSSCIEYETPASFSVRPGIAALEVRGSSMENTTKEGGRIYYDEKDIRTGALALKSLWGLPCICWLLDGRVLFKELDEGKRLGYSYLHSPNERIMKDEMVVRAAPVVLVAPPTTSAPASLERSSEGDEVR